MPSPVQTTRVTTATCAVNAHAHRSPSADYITIMATMTTTTTTARWTVRSFHHQTDRRFGSVWFGLSSAGGLACRVCMVRNLIHKVITRNPRERSARGMGTTSLFFAVSAFVLSGWYVFVLFVGELWFECANPFFIVQLAKSVFFM